MRRSIPLRVKVIVAIIFLVALLSAAVFYLTAVRFHRLVEGALAAQHSTGTKTAAWLWDRGIPAAEIAQLWMNDPIIQQMIFYSLDARTETFPKVETHSVDVPLSVFHHDFEKPDGQVKEIGEPSGILHRGGHRLVASAEGDSGRVEVLFSTAMINLEVARLVGVSIWIIVGVILLTGLGVFLIDRRLRRVIKKMISTTNAITSGRLDLRLDIQTGDQLEELGEGFNQLAASLAGRQAEIDRAQKELSATIAARTAELREERDRLSRILDNLPSAFILFDQDMNITAASSAVERLTGVIHAIGGSPVCFCPQAGEDAEGCVVRLANARQGAVTGRQFQTGFEGVERTLEHSVFPVRDDSHIVGWLETITDVTERVQQHERLIKAERSSAVGETAAILAHEVRNLLTSAKMLLQIDIEADNLTISQKEHIYRTVDSIKGMEQMIEDLLAFAKPSPIKKETVDIDGVVISVVNQVRPIAADSGTTIELLNQAGGAKASLDVEKTQQALVNLLLNAIQAAGDGGTARLTVAWSQSPEAPGKLDGKGASGSRPSAIPRFLRFAVDDTGPGVAADLRGKVFEPFFTTRARGTGLGLAMVRQIARDHSGRIFVEEGPRGGAQFVMIIPA